MTDNLRGYTPTPSQLTTLDTLNWERFEMTNEIIFGNSIHLIETISEENGEKDGEENGEKIQEWILTRRGTMIPLKTFEPIEPID